jgi:hypothetical protein
MISPTLNLLVSFGAVLLWAASPTEPADPDPDQEQTINCDGLPPAVQTSFQKLFPQATADSCSEEEEMGRSAYEVSSVEGKTRRDTLFSADGALVVVEEAIAAADLPESVQRAWNEGFADNSIVLAERVTRDGTVTYEIQSLRAGKSIETVFDANGKELTKLSPSTR